MRTWTGSSPVTDRFIMAEIVFAARKFRVERLVYDIPGQGERQRDVVVHPGAALIVPMLSPTEVVMIRNYRTAIGEELLELPAGTLEPPEPPIECAARELEEETGYRAARIEALCEFYTTPGFCTERMHAFVATDLTPGRQQLESSEQIRVETLSLEDAIAACHDGRILDGKTIAALLIHHVREVREP